MKNTSPFLYVSPIKREMATRGSALITALIFAIIIGITLAGYVALSTNSLKLAHRTFLADAANNLAEAGTEEAVWSFNQLGNSTDTTKVNQVWSGWTLGNSVADVAMESMGYDYTSVPTVKFIGDGSGAAGVATITTTTVTTGGVDKTYTGVSKITLTNPGTGYTSAPTVELVGGGGTAALARARLSATRTFQFPNLGQGVTGTVQVWVDGYDGTAVLPIVVTKATVRPVEGPPIIKIVKIILNKSGLLPKGLIAKYGIRWNGHPIANSFVSSAVTGVPPFTQYDANNANSNITVGSMFGPEIDLGAQGVIEGNVTLGPGVKLTGSGTVTGQTVGNMNYNFKMPAPPVNKGGDGYYALGTQATLPDVLPVSGDVPAADGNYYYFVNGATIGETTITEGKKVVIVGTGTQMKGGLTIIPDNPNGKVTIFMDGPMSPGNDSVNTSNWAGALEIYTTTTADCEIKGNGYFAGCLTAPFAELVGDGGGNDTQDLCGSFVVGSVRSNGHLSFHYDEGLSVSTNPKAWTLALWTELQSAAERGIYANRFNF